MNAAQKLEQLWIEREMEMDRICSKYALEGNMDHCRIIGTEIITLKRCRVELQEAFGLVRHP